MHPELEHEHAYVDHAYRCLEEMRRQLERAGEAAVGLHRASWLLYTRPSARPGARRCATGARH